ncbi:MAG: DUF350 domain-containing protein, partial [Nitrospinae bacterium]|nr:DUF350 domain-containing protein [Nitrospinota bacterium]
MLLFDTFLTAIVYLVVFFILFLVGKITFARFNYGFDLNKELVEHDNPCVALMLGGYLIGMMLIMKGVISGPSLGLMEDVINQIVYGFIGLLLLNLSQIINDKFILNEFKILDEI